MINNQNCFAVNFGYNGEIPLPTISFSKRFSQKFENSYKCFFVFVGGKYIEKMITVVDTVGDISHQFHGIKPIAIFVKGPLRNQEINNFSSHVPELTKVLCIMS